MAVTRFGFYAETVQRKQPRVQFDKPRVPRAKFTAMRMCVALLCGHGGLETKKQMR